MREPDPEAAAEQARAGVRAWVRRAGSRVRSAGPYAILAFLTASAVAPIAGAGLGAPSEFTTALDQLGGMGSNFLADAMADTAKRLRNPTADEWREALAADLLPRLAAAGEDGRALHEEISRVLREVDAVNTAIGEAAVVDEELRHTLEAAFQELGLGVRELRWMLTDVRESVDRLGRQLATQSLRLHRELDEVRRHLVAFTREQLPAGDGVPADVPGGAVPPYPGLVHFEPEDAPWFRGREPEVAELLGRLAEQAVGGPPLIVTGVSGAGKSSLVRAGLLPGLAGGALGAQAAAWPWVVTSPGVRPLARLREKVRALAGGAAGRSLGELAAKAAADGNRPVIVVDQFEELFTQCPDPAERLAYATELTTAAPALVVIAVRSDFYPACVALPPLAGVLAAGHVVIGPLTPDAIRRAVVEPAEHSGLSVEPGLPDLLLRDLGADDHHGYEPGALPLLAHALRATWDQREGVRLTIGAYRATGGIRHAVADTAERIYLEQPPDDRERLREALLALVTVTEDGTVARRRGERAAADSRVLRRLVRARLVTVGADTVEISHEALLTGWPRLAGWVAEAREDLLLRRRITEAAEDWDRSGRDPDLLPRGSRLLAARESLTGPDGVVGAYLAAGRAAADQREADRRRGTNRLRRLAAGLAAALLLAVGGGLYALDQREESERQSRDSLSRQYAAESVGALRQDEGRAVRKALAGWHTAPTTEARSALLSAQMTRFAGRLGTAPGGWSAAVSPDGSRIAVGHTDGTIRLWNATTLTPQGEPLAYPQQTQVTSLAFSPDGRFLLSGAFVNPGVRIWDAATGRPLRTLEALGAATWLPGSATVVAAHAPKSGADLRLGLFDAATGRLTRAFAADPGTGWDIAASPDGRFVAERGANDRPQLWSVSEGRPVTTLPEAVYLAFAPDGTLITAGRGGDVAQWEVPSGRRLRTVASGSSGSSAPGRIAVTGDGMVISNGIRRTANISSLTNDIPGTLDTGLWAYGAAASSANGQVVVVTGPEDPTVVFRRAVNFLNNDRAVYDVAFSPDGRTLAAGGLDGTVRIWDTASRELVRAFRPAGGVSGLVHADGGVLGVATFAGTLEIWDADGGRLARVPLPGEPRDLVLSPDRRLLAVSTGSRLEDEPGTVPSGVLVYDVAGRKPVGTAGLGDDTAYAIAFSADGAVLHTAVTTTTTDFGTGRPAVQSVLRSWRVPGLTEIGGQHLGRYQALDLAVSPDGRQLAVTGTNRVVDVRSAGGERTIWQSPVQLGQVDRIAFSPDARTLAVTGVRGDVQLWDGRSRTVTATLEGHTEPPAGLAFSPDGQLLATAGTDSQVGVWPLDPAAAVRRLCRIEIPLSRTEGSEPSPLCS
ncbi:AAA family ATPase [Actinoplanes sp. NPDC023714]|uniref:NACHT and WD repeat domain-containing protein n=1 Tax=Actinoplanes sp. NPDC023714 TaxID=3154322 RepID=UPI0033DED683